MTESLGGLSDVQYTWLKTRLEVASDAEACRLTGVSKEMLRNWKRSPIFTELLDASRSDQALAFRLLSLHLARQALEALEWLLKSDRGVDKKAGLEIFRLLLGSLPGQEDTSERKLQILINTLNVKAGELGPGGVMESIGLLPAPRAVGDS